MSGTKYACVEIEVPRLPGGRAFMKLQDNADTPENVIVWLAAQPFMKFWLATDRTKSRIRTWEWSEHKRNHDTACMVEGVENPVPLAVANFHVAEDGEIIFGFTNGMSRTAILVDYGAPAVPLMMRRDEAAQLLTIIPGYIDTLPWKKTRDEMDFSAACYEETTLRRAYRWLLNRRLPQSGLSGISNKL